MKAPSIRKKQKLFYPLDKIRESFRYSCLALARKSIEEFQQFKVA